MDFERIGYELLRYLALPVALFIVVKEKLIKKQRRYPTLYRDMTWDA